VIVTGRGELDMSTRSFVFKLSKITPTPTIYGLFDADPYGATIYCTYKFGPARLSVDNIGLTASSMIWIGVDFNDLIDRVDKSLLVPLTETDMTMLNNMTTKVYAMADFAFKFHIFRMRSEKLKGEVECLHSLGLDVLYNCLCCS
jgi:DNA topoisomerase VI subunit A